VDGKRKRANNIQKEENPVFDRDSATDITERKQAVEGKKEERRNCPYRGVAWGRRGERGLASLA